LWLCCAKVFHKTATQKLPLSSALSRNSMNESDRSFAEAILNRIMKGGSINGMRFFTPQLLIDGPSDIRQEAFINLESSWVLFESLPETLPGKIEEMSREQEELEILKLISCRQILTC
jgi:hypothetical protein